MGSRVLVGERRLVVRTPETLLPEEVANWERLLATDSSLMRAFMSLQYVRAVNASGRNVFVIVGYVGDEACWFLPLQRFPDWPGLLGTFEPVGGVMTDYFGVVAANGVSFSLPEIFSAARSRVGGILFTHLDEMQTSFGLSGEEARTGLRTCLDGGFDAYWAALRKTDKKLVYDTERREKKLIAERGEIVFEWQSSNPERDIDTLIELKRSQYVRTNKERAPLFNEANVALIKRLLSSENAECQGVLSVMKCNGEIIALHFGLRCHHVLHVWFPVYLPSFSSYSPGRILMRNIFKAGCAQGVTLFDRGEGDSQAKRDFANQEHRFFRGYWKAPTVLGWLSNAALSVYWRL